MELTDAPKAGVQRETPWPVVSLADLASFRTGPFGSALHKSDYVVGGVPLVNPMHIIDGQIEPEAEVSVSPDTAKRLSDFQLRSGDVVIGRRGEMGRCAVVGDREDGWLCGTGSLIIRPKDSVSPVYLQRVLASPEVIAKIESGSVGSTMVNLNQSVLRSLEIPSPSETEQQAIAAALTEVDDLIAALDALIEKKRAVKTAAMQRLLTGRQRLAGFDGAWETRRLGDLAATLKGKGLSKSALSSSGQRACLLYGELFTTYDQVIRDVVSRTDSADGLPSRAGDVLLPGSTTTSGIDLATASALLVDDVALGGDVIVLRATGSHYDPEFLASYLTHAKTQEIADMAQGITIIHLYGRNLADLVVELPPVAEQRAIAAILIDMDAEVAALAARRDKTRQVKTGMMQELLTGRTRLV